MPSGIELHPVARPEARRCVLDITEFWGPTSGGVRTYLTQKGAWLRAQPWARQVVVVPGARDAVEDDASGASRRYELRGPPVPGQPPYRFLTGVRAVPRIVRHERPDLIEVGSPGVVPWVAARAARAVRGSARGPDASARVDRDIPLVTFFHSNFPRIYNPFPERSGVTKRVVTGAMWRYVKHIDRHSRVTIACSDFAAEDLRRAGVDRVERLPLGVDLELFHPRRRSQRDEARARYGLPRNTLLAAYIGRFANEKEIGTLLEGWEQAYRRTGMHLALVGDGPVRAALERWTRDHAWAHVVPFETDRTRLAELHAALDVYAAPGPVETFGLSGLEALASGTPVLSVHRGGVAEQVTSSGAGQLFQAGRPETVAPALERLLAADRAELARRARAHAEGEHSWDAVFTKVFALYDRVLAGEYD